LPAAPYLHLFVAHGRLEVEGVGELSAGDAVRFSASDGRCVVAGEPSEILAWEMRAGLMAKTTRQTAT
jgi:redox-sensitive bicupin YhaK (pirin superfamily)